MSTKLGDAYVSVEPDFSGFQEKVAAKLNAALGPAMDKAGKNAGKRLGNGIANDSSLRSSLQPLLKRFQKTGDNLGEELAAHIGKGTKRASGDMFGLSGAINEMEKRSSSASSRAKVLANDTFGIGKAAQDAGQGYKLLKNSTRDWGKEASKVDSIGKRLSKGLTGLFKDVKEVAGNLKAAAGGFGDFEGVMARANRGFQFFRNILGSIKIPALVAGVALFAQSLSALAAGVFATASALGPLTGALIAIPAAALAGAQAVGVLKLALSGIGDAVKAGLTAQIAGGEQATQTMHTQENAAEALADAHRTLASSERDETYATEELSKARKEATAQLADMRRASEESQLTEREGTLALREARRELNKTLREPAATGLSIQSAEQAVERAKFGLESTREEAKKARKEYSEANAKGVGGMPEVVSAKRSLADANRSVADAERGVAKAIRENTAALEGQGSAATALQQKLAALTPTGRKFAKFLIGLKPQFDALRESAGKGFLPGAEKGIGSAMKNFGVFKGIVGETSGALGGLAKKAGAKLGSEAWGRDLGKIGASNTKVIENLGQAGLNLGDAFRNILVSAEPLIEWMGKGVVKFSEWSKTSSQAGRESGGLSHFFDETREAMEKVWHILKPLGEGLLNIGKAAKPLGNEILDSLGKSAEGFAKWTDSVKGKNQLKNYFVEVKPTIFAIGRLIRDATDDFADMGRQKGVSTLIESIRTGLLPLLSGGANGITGLLGGFIDKFDDLRKEGVPAFDAFVQTLAEHSGEAAIKIAEALVRGFLNAPILGKLAIGGWLLSKFGGRSAFSALGSHVGKEFGVGVEESAASSVGGGAVTKSLGSRLKTGFISLGKQLGYAMAAYGIFEGVKTAATESKGAHSIGDTLHNFAIGAFGAFGIDLGETTAEHFQKGFTGRIKTLATTGFIAKQMGSPLTPQIQARATTAAESQVPAGEGAPGFEEAYERALSNIMKSVQTHRASAKQLFGAFWEDMGPDEKTFAKALRRALVQGERLVKQTGITLPKVKLETNPAQTAKAAKEILSKFQYLREGIGNNLHDINKVSKEAGERIVNTFGAGTKEARTLTARNMKLTAEAIATQMKRSGDFTQKGMERIKELIRNAKLLAPTKKMAEEFGGEWAKGVGSTKKATSEAVENIIGEAKRMPPAMRKIAVETWLEQLTQARKSGKLTADAFREMRSKVFAEFGVFKTGTKAFNKEVAESFVGMVNSSGGAMGVLMQNLSGILGTLGKGKLNWKIVDAKIGKDVNGASLGRQRGGPVPARAHGGLASVVPGSSTGDRHTLALNGRPIAKVESREGIFVGNRKMMAAASAANAAVPRFQKGGVARKVKGALTEPQLDGNSGSLKDLGQQAIHKVFQGAKGYLDKHKVSAGGGGGVVPIGHGVDELDGHPVADWIDKILVAARKAGVPFSVESGYRTDAEQTAIYESGVRPAAVPISLGGSGSNHEGIDYPAGAVDISPGAEALSAWLLGSKFANTLIYAGAKDPVHFSHPHDGGYQEGGLLGFIKGLQGGGFAGSGYTVKGLTASAQQMRTAAEIQEAGDKTMATHLARVAAEMAATQESNMGSTGNTFQVTATTGPGNANDNALTQAMRWFTSGYYDGPVLGEGGGIEKSRKSSDPTLIAQEVEGSAYPTAYAPWKSEGQKWTDGWEEGKESSAAATGPKAETKPKEKALPTYGGVSTSTISFGHPKTLKATEQELDRLSKMRPRYASAANKAGKDGKQATAELLQARIHQIDERVKGLRKQRNQLRFAEATKALKHGITGKLAKIAGYGQRVEGSKRLYEEAAEYATQVVGLEPESPEIAAEPELPENATDKQRRDAHNAYEKSREATEKTYVSNYSGYVEGQERPAYQTILERVADWRNNILRAERFGYGKGEPSVDDMERGWEKSTRNKIGQIGGINDFTQKVGERIQEYWAKVKEEVSDCRQAHPGQGLSKHLEEEQDGLPDWLQKQVEQRDRLREKLPFLRDEKGQLETAIGEAREAFYPGGEGRLSPPVPPLPGSGSFEDDLTEVQGLHQFPIQHELLGAGDLAGPNSAGAFGGVIWDVRESIQGLGLKLRQAGSSVQKASLEGAGNGTEDNSERDQLLEELLRQANEKLAINGALGPVLKQFEASYPLPFAGTFHTGGVIGGPGNSEAIAKVRSGEGVFTPEQMAAMAPAEPTSSAPFTIEQLNMHEDGRVTARYQGREFEVAVEDIVKKTSRPLVGSGAGRAFR